MNRLFTFIGGHSGAYAISRISPVVGEDLPLVPRLQVVPGSPSQLGIWSLQGVTSNVRYTTLPEKQLLVARQVDIGRPEATLAALIPIRKSSAWWDLTQDHRRMIFEDSSRHVQAGLRYLPAISRRLHHCRDLAEPQAFDFLTFFDYEPKDAQAFEELVGELRRTEEWKYVEREVDVRLVRE